jgi:hypothetical protein
VKSIILRPATPADLPFIKRFHAEQNERDGTSYPLPRLFDKDGNLTDRAPVVLVGVEEGSDEPVQAIWVERRAELMFAGCDPKATAFARRDIDGLAAVLTWLGYSGLHCDVPVALVEAIGKPLGKAGFEQNDHNLAHFFKDLREKTP